MTKILLSLLAIFLVIHFTESRTVRWTGTGGTFLWDFARNWDCNCIPTADDDVIIDVANVAGNVRVAANPAVCKSLTVGGSSTTGQSLYVQGQLSIGPGGAVINPNGDISLDSSPVAPLTCDGIFSGSNRFQFKSGTLAGKGQFVFESMNMTTPAQKQINASTTVRGLLWVLPGAGQNGLITVSKNTLQVGTLQTEEALTLSSDDTQSASIEITTANFNGAAKQYIMRGYTSVSNLNLNNGQLTIQNAVDIDKTVIASGASVNLIGGPESIRTFNTLSGAGTFVVQGGTNTLKGSQLSTLQLSSGKLSSDGPLVFVNAALLGGELSGKATVNTTMATFGSCTLTGVQLTTTNLEINGISTLSGSSVTLTATGKVTANGQLTLNAGAAFNVGPTAQFTQSGPFSLVPGADAPAPSVRNDGTWTVSSTGNYVVNIAGNGKWALTNGSSLQTTGVNFNAGSVDVATSWKFLGVTGNIGTLSGAGYVELNGKVWTITTATVNTLAHVNGQTTVTTGTGVGTLIVSSGTFMLGQMSVSLFNFSSGTVQGTAPSSALKAASTVFSGTIPKFLTNLQVTSAAVNWACLGASQSCQVVFNNAALTTGTTSRSYTLAQPEDEEEESYDYEDSEDGEEDFEDEDFEDEVEEEEYEHVVHNVRLSDGLFDDSN